MKIAVVVPTIRPEQYKKFLAAWKSLFEKHDVYLYTVFDGNLPRVEISHAGLKANWSMEEVFRGDTDLIYNYSDAVRNLGFALAYIQEADVIISLDDDTTPFGDTIQDHLDVLSKKYPISWMNTAQEIYMRGFPYNIRNEAECVLSHGVWNGVADFDASTQIVLGTPKLTYPKMPVPSGVLFPMCIMNVAFKRKMTPFMYQAPMAYKLEDDSNIKVNRFADIWGGIEAKKSIDANGWCAFTGGAVVNHDRASDPFVNLVKEASGIAMNEKYGEGKYFQIFADKRAQWIKFLQRYE